MKQAIELGRFSSLNTIAIKTSNKINLKSNYVHKSRTCCYPMHNQVQSVTVNKTHLRGYSHMYRMHTHDTDIGRAGCGKNSTNLQVNYMNHLCARTPLV